MRGGRLREVVAKGGSTVVIDPGPEGNEGSTIFF